MFIDKDSIIINGVSVGQYLTEVEFSYPKLWGEDTGRTLAGDFKGTLLGIYVKIILNFRKLTKEELEIIAPILDSVSQNIQYYDPVKKATITIQTYSGDWSVINNRIITNGNKNEGFKISFISRKKRV